MNPRLAIGALVVLFGLLVPALDGAASPAELERRAKAFYELLARGKTSQAKSTWQPLEREIAAKVDELQDRMDGMRETVIDQNGSLESLYRSQRWRDPELASMVLGYHLAWVRYQGAQLTDDKAVKRRLLRKAADGFSQFTIVNEVPEIYAESLYGRGLAFMDLGQYGNAIADLEAAAADRRTAGKARAALAEARRRASGAKPVKKPPGPADLLERLRAMLPRATGNSNTAKEATELARGIAANGGTWPTRVDDTVTETLGDGSRASVRSSYGLYLLAQLSIDRRRCRDLPSLVATGAAVHDAGRARYRPELLFMNAGCVLNAGKPKEAAALFDELLQEFPKSSRSQDAGYYRFRALDTARADDPMLDGAYREAAESFIERHPGTKRASEARFHLAEDLRAARDCEEATELYAAVTTGGYVTRARLGILECEVGGLGPDSPADERVRVRTDLEAFVKDTPTKGSDAAAVARAALLAALVAASSKPPASDVTVRMLSDYETRFPEQTEWHAMVRETRLEALLALGRLDDARVDVEGVAAEPLAPETRRLLARVGNDLVARAERAPEGDPEGEQAAALAYTIFVALAADGEDTGDQLILANLELRAGRADEAGALYEAVLAQEPDSSQARRGAARAAAARGDHQAALGHWRAVIQTSAPGGTGWYEARLAQIDLLVADDRRDTACDLLHRSLGQATTTGGDVLEKRLRVREAEICSS